MEIIKIKDGFKFNKLDYKFDTSLEVEKLSETTCHIPTDQGIIYFDISVNIDGKSFDNIQDWITELYK